MSTALVSSAKPETAVPGPGIFEVLASARRNCNNFPLAMLREAHQRYGDVFVLRQLNHPVYVLGHPDLVEQVLLTNHRKYRKDILIRRHKGVFGEGLLSAEGAEWLRNRRMIQPIFHRKRTESYGAVMVEEALRLAESLRVGQQVDVQEEMAALTLRIVVKTLFGIEPGPELERTAEALEAFVAHFRATMIFNPWPDWLPVAVNRNYRACITTLHTIVDTLIAERKASGVSGEDLLGMLLAARDETGEALSAQQVRDEVITFLLAGHETTAQTLTFTFLLLEQHPQVAAKLEEELARFSGDTLPTAADYGTLPYLEAVLKESMRLHPPAAATGRELTEPDELGGYVIPPGRKVLLPFWLLHHDPRYFEDPEAFLPERWLGDFESRLHKFAYLPFGGGQRLCIGRGFALMEAQLILATLLPRLRFRRLSQKEPMFRSSITLRLQGGLPAIVERRG